MKVTNEISKNVAELRKSLKVSQDEFGYRIGVSRSKVSSWEIGRRDISISDAVAICNYYNISLDSLLNPKAINSEKLMDILNTFVQNRKLSPKEKEEICKRLQNVFMPEKKENIPA